MSDDLVKRAREVLNGVTPGPWIVEYKQGDMRLLMGNDCKMCDTTYYPWTPDEPADWEFIATSRELVPAMADRIEELEAKLAKAVEALRFYGSICADKDKSPWNVYSEDFGRKARAALAEINGGGDT